jgi:hypothetical protein
MEREDSSAAQAEDAKFAASRELIIDPPAGAEPRQLEEAQAESRETEIRGDSKISSRQHWGGAVAGQPAAVNLKCRRRN